MTDRSEWPRRSPTADGGWVEIDRSPNPGHCLIRSSDGWERELTVDEMNRMVRELKEMGEFLHIISVNDLW